jgi:hypothetical protein
MNGTTHTEVQICDKCKSNSFVLNDAYYPKCSVCGNDLTDIIQIEVI